MSDNDESNRAYPRWAHKPGVPLGTISKVVNSAAEERETMANWEAESAPAAQVVNALVAPVGIVPEFTIYDIGEDKEVPLTQDRLDVLLAAEEAIFALWPAIRRDQETGSEFPSETSIAISKVSAMLEQVVAPEGDAEVAAPKRRGRPPKPKPETVSGTGS